MKILSISMLFLASCSGTALASEFNPPPAGGSFNPTLATEVLTKTHGAAIPFTWGGPLRTGQFHCVLEVEVLDIASVYQFNLTVFSDGAISTESGTRSNKYDGTKGLPDYAGVYRYTPSDGALNVTGIDTANTFEGLFLWNSQEGAFHNSFRFLTDASGKAFFWGNGGESASSHNTTRCNYAGAAQRTSPAASQGMSAEDVVSERKGYQTDAGKGLTDDQVEGFLLERRVRNGPDGKDIDVGTAKLLLRDGWGYDHQLSFPPQDFNAALSRKREPQNWFQWRKTGGHIEVLRDGGAWTKANGAFGRAVKPIELIGVFANERSLGGNPGMLEYLSTRAAFSQEGHVTITVTERRFPDKPSVFSGSYALDGYTLTMRLEGEKLPGMEARLPLFSSEDGSAIRIADTTMVRQ
jgi:hypothetical protein